MLYAFRGPRGRYKLGTVAALGGRRREAGWRVVTILGGPAG